MTYDLGSTETLLPVLVTQFLKTCSPSILSTEYGESPQTTTGMLVRAGKHQVSKGSKSPTHKMSPQKPVMIFLVIWLRINGKLTNNLGN